MKQILLLCIFLAGLVTPAGAQTAMSQEELTERITSLSFSEHPNWRSLDPALQWELVFTQSYLQIENCSVTSRVFRLMFNGQSTLVFEYNFDLHDVFLAKGMDWSLGYDGVPTENDYTYSKEYHNSGEAEIAAYITFERYDRGEITYFEKDLSEMGDSKEIDFDTLGMIPKTNPVINFNILNPTDETQLRDLAALINEYRDRFCTITG